MTIVHLIFSFNTGGSETMVVDIANEQCKSNKVKLIVVNDHYNKNLLSTVNPEVEIVMLKRKPGNKFSLSTIFKLWRMLIENTPNIIHCHNHKLIQLIPFWKSIAVITVHDVKTPTHFLLKYKKVFSISNEVASDIYRRGNVGSVVVYNGILIDQYYKKQEYNYNPKEDFKIIQISRLIQEKKGQDIAIKALKQLVDKHDQVNIQLYFVGEGESLTELEELASKLNITGKVHFLGQQTREWIKKNLLNYHILIQPSIYEGFGLTILEGLAAKLPVIASNIDGPKEILNFLKVGYLIEPADHHSLANSIEAIYSQYLTGTTDMSHISPEKDLLNNFNIIATSAKYIKEYCV
jgi:glycosyltransferase involved in cell wall biosynthesis